NRGSLEKGWTDAFRDVAPRKRALVPGSGAVSSPVIRPKRLHLGVRERARVDVRLVDRSGQKIDRIPAPFRASDDGVTAGVEAAAKWNRRLKRAIDIELQSRQRLVEDPRHVIPDAGDGRGRRLRRRLGGAGRIGGQR